MLAKLSTAGIHLMVKSCQRHLVSYTPPCTLPDPFKKMLSIDLNPGHGGS
jgi:hypothetical protein